MVKVKICGLKSELPIKQAVSSGVDYIGFVFYNKSPRYVDPQSVKLLSKLIPKTIKTVGLFVNAPLVEMEKILEDIELDYLQLHGQESPQVVSNLKLRFDVPIIKAIGISEKSDLQQIKQYETICDQILIDTKTSHETSLPGGNGLVFDWGLVSNCQFACPWILAGGLTSKNVSKAINVSGATQVDVSSGVEIEFGIKDHLKIADFIKVAKNGEKNGR